MNMTLVVARKEIQNVIRNKGLIFAGLYVGGMFGVLNLLLSGQVLVINNTVFSVSLFVGVFVGYSFSGSVFCERSDRK